jgi:hypothetical protein
LSDIFHEIEEEVRRQQYEKLWKRYGTYVIAGAVAIIVATAAYIGWKNYTQSELDRESTEFSRLIQDAQVDPSSSAEAIAKFAENSSGGYRALGLFAEAAATMPRDKIAAVKIYEKIAEEYPDPYFGGLARLKAAILSSDTASTDQLRERLGPVLNEGSIWRHSGRELMAYAAFRDGNLQGARQAFDELRSDLSVPDGIRTRSEQMIEQIDLRLAGVTPRVMDAPAPAQPPAGAPPAPPAGAPPTAPPSPPQPQAQNTPAQNDAPPNPPTQP